MFRLTVQYNRRVNEVLDKEALLDCNEIHILYAAIHMYLLYLRMNREDSLISSCLIVCKQFSLLVEQLDGKK
jgi:hypothetical protein